MICDELIAKINFYNSDSVREALYSVVELHKPITIEDYGSECEHCKFCGVCAPCPTIQAIEKELHNGTH